MRLQNQRLFAPILVIILAASLAGCYTLLKHPTIAEAPEEEAGFRRCMDCHDGYAYGDRYDQWYPPPWWLDPASVVIDRDSASALPYRGIINHEPVKRPIGGSGIGTTNPASGSGALVPSAKGPAGQGQSQTGDGAVIKKHTVDDSQKDKRAIEERSTTKRGGDENRSNDAKDAKKDQSSDANDATKASDATKDTKEKKKE
jgi:hypothetical protein